MPSYREIFVSSPDPFERGLQHGKQASEEIKQVIAGYQQLFLKEMGYSWGEVVELAKGFTAYLTGKMDDLLEEAKGIAQGAGVPFEEIMVLNTRYELLKFPKAAHECTGFAVLPEASEKGETIMGQNWDTMDFVGKGVYVLHIDEGNGTRILGLTEPGQLIRNGMNSYGISVNSMNLLSIYDKAEAGVPTNFARRRILQAHNFEEAEALVRSFQFPVSCNYFIGSREGIAADFEATPEEVFQVLPQNGVLGHGNDFVIDPSVDRDFRSFRHFRGQRLHRLLLEKGGGITPEYIQQCLRDHYRHPLSVCNHTGEKEGEYGLHTIASMLYCLDRECAYICRDNPCVGTYECYQL